MARTIGATNKDQNLPAEYGLTVDQRIEMLAVILTDLISEELCKTE